MVNANWDELTRGFMKPAGEELLHVLQPAAHELVLDITPQTGESGLYTAASLTSRPGISNMFSDPVRPTAIHHTPISGTISMETLCSDVSDLPFENNTFDAISCSYGFMFFPDAKVAAREMYRVLKPGAKIAVAAWNVPQKNPWLMTILDVVEKNTKLSVSINASPGTFRCAEDGYLLNLFIEAGFKNIQTGVVKSNLIFPSAEMYWKIMTAVGGPVFAALHEIDAAVIAKIKYEVYELLDAQFGRNDIRMRSDATILYAEKK